MTAHLYGLLHLCADESSAVNVKVKSFWDQIAIYTNCAINLSDSLKVRGVEFTLLTNEKDIVTNIVQSESKELQVEEIPFSVHIPNGTKFYSAHYKLDVYRFLSTLTENYVGLCDLDMICINDMPRCLFNNIVQGIPIFYDVSDQAIPVCGCDSFVEDLKLVQGYESEGRWSGGEFISGTPAFFSALSKEVDCLFGRYISNIENLHHVGDEVVTSAALEVLRKKGIYIADGGTLGIIGRFWSTNTLHPQKPFSYFEKCFLLHLPADKRYLANWGKNAKDNRFLRTFPKYYASYRYKRAVVAKFKKMIRKMFVVIGLKKSHNKEKRP